MPRQRDRRFNDTFRGSVGLWLALYAVSGIPYVTAAENETAPAPPATVEDREPGPAFPGLDGSVNERLAEEAGRPARAPYFDTESMGDLWNTLLLLAGGICGFILGRYWDHLWGRPREPRSADAARGEQGR